MRAMSDTRAHIHELVDLSPQAQLSAIEGLLKAMPDEDEPVTDEDRRIIAEGQAYIAARGKMTSMEDLLAEFGLKLSDFPLKK